MTRVFLSILSISLATLGGAVKLQGQTIVSGEIAGLVTDPSGAAVPYINLTAESDAYGDTRTVKTNAQGAYQLTLLRPGVYTLTVQAKGFETMHVRATAALGQIAKIDIRLSLQAQATFVEVTTDTPLLQNENANVGITFSQNQLQNLPVGGSDMVAYAYSSPGVSMSTGAGYGAFTAFGLPATSNLFTINGSDLMDPYVNIANTGASNLSIGANELQEAVVITNGYAGQYGRQAGAQVNYLTKSGSNSFHGNSLWNWNGTKLNANDFFQNSFGEDRPHAVSNQWAASLGGPIVKNKLFFYWNYEGFRYVLPSGGLIGIPTAAFANAVLTNLNATNPAAVPFYNKIFSLYAGSTGAAQAVPVTAATDPSLGCGSKLPGTIGAFGVTQPCARQFQARVNNLNTEWSSAERIDYNLSVKDRIYFRAWTDRGVQATGTDAINPAFNANSVQPQWSTQLGYTRVFNARAVNDLALSGFYYSSLFGPANLSAALSLFPTTLSFKDGLFSQLGGGANANAVGLNNFPSGRKVAQYQIVDDFSYTLGSHEFKAGVNFRRNDVGDYSYGPGTSGALNFSSLADFYNGVITPANGSTYVQTFTRIGAEHIGLYSLGAYIQDQWRVRHNLSLTLALRMESAGNPTCGTNCFSRPNSSFTELTHDRTQPYSSVIQTGLGNAFTNFEGVVAQPRLGFAYTWKNKTAIRGGVGLFADQFQGALVSRFFTNLPNVISLTATSGVAAPAVARSAFSSLAASNAALQAGFSSGATLAQLQAIQPNLPVPNLYTQADTLRLPRYLEWNVEVQRELSQYVNLSVNYVANHGWNETSQNPYLNAYSTTGFGGLPTTPADPRFGEILELSTQGHSNYDGLTPSVRWRWHSLLGSASYTWSHNLDTCSNNCIGQFNLATSPSLRYQLTPAGIDSSYGNADYDIRQSFTANYVWNISTHFQNAALKNTLGGWAVGGTFMSHSGYPFSVTNTSLRSSYIKNSSGVATIVVLPTWLGSPEGSCSSPDTPCVSSSQFAKTAAQTGYGNLARNSFRGPGYFDTDLSINKDSLIAERFHFIIGANFYNVLNHPNFDLPVNSLSSGLFGQIVSTVTPASSAYGSFQGSAVSGRIAVLHAKFQF